MIGSSVVRDARRALREAGLHASFLVRDLDTGEELGIDPDTVFPAASLVKIPLAVVTLQRIARRELDPAERLEIAPGAVTTPGPTGLTKFRHPATVAIDDLLYLAVAVSDNTAADALFDLTPPEEIDAALRGLGITDIAVRHQLRALTDTPAERFAPADLHLAHTLAITGGAATAPGFPGAAATGFPGAAALPGAAGGGHPLAQLDVSRANTGTARGWAGLLAEIWRPATLDPAAAARTRELLGDNVIRHRLAPDFSTDAARWSSKTGTLLNLRHEAGVVEHTGGPSYAVVALTESRIPAAVQTGTETLMGRIARTLRDTLRT